eukprot:TRINITY_DN4902_c0_g1_i1.p1 TRINITY_DN4902_c0_g1~~TRINITY_DN4902_c0_g1_i1.p1  ORF type:complete len:570 (-),score=187.65 TRINITY_DN4902_c0_g1_i1:1154-2863(-)
MEPTSRLLVVFCVASIIAICSATGLSSQLLHLDASIKEPSQLPGGSECWNAVSMRWKPCQSMTEDDKYRFSLELVNCFLLKSRGHSYECSAQQAFTDCTKHMAGQDLNILAQFFTYVENYCLRADVQRFQAQTAQAVSSMYHAAEQTTEHLSTLNSQASDISSSLSNNKAKLDLVSTQQQAISSTLTQLSTQQEAQFAHTSTQLHNLTSLSSVINDTVQSAVTQGEELLSMHVTLQQQQQQLQEVASTTLVRLHDTGTALHAQMQDSLQQQRTLLANQRAADQALDHLTRKQAEVSVSVTAGLEQQRVLVAVQQNMSYQQQALHEVTVLGLQHLSQRSDVVLDKLDQSLSKEDQLLASQIAAHQHISELMLNHSASLQFLSLQSDAVKQAFVFVSEHLYQLRVLLLTEFFDFKSALFYLVALVTFYAATATQRTNTARFPVLAVVFLTVIVEKAILAKLLMEPESYISSVWTLRKITFSASMLLVVATAVRHRDLNKLNNVMLTRVLDQQAQTTDQMEQLTSDSHLMRSVLESVQSTQQVILERLERLEAHLSLSASKPSKTLAIAMAN